MTVEQLALREAIKNAFIEAVEAVGYEAIKRTSAFGSNDSAFVASKLKQAA